MSTRNNTPDPNRWMLGGEPPEPQTHKTTTPPVDANGKPLAFSTADTHTGTDPLGRAIGPREDHTKVKRVRALDGDKIVKPYEIEVVDGKTKAKPIDTRPAEARVAKVAEATDTRAEAVDEPTPLSPAEVAQLHEANATPEGEG